MSDTPRTDGEAFLPHDSKYRVCDVDFVRQLERELNAANQISKKYEDRYFKCLERIKRLEEENDALRADLLLWNKAGIGFTTEDKP